MRVITSYGEINNELYILESNVLTKIGCIVKNLTSDKVLNLGENICRCFHSESYLYTITKQNIKIYNERFDELNNISLSEAEGIIIFGINNYIVRIDENLEDYYLIFENNILIKKEKLFYGGYYENKFRIEYKKEEDVLVGYIITNLLDTKTYFEFKCELGYELVSDFYIWQDTLVFMYFKDSDLKLEQRDIKTGMMIWKTDIKDSSFVFDYTRGLMVSVWGNSGRYPENKDQYQIIDLEKQTAEIGIPQKNFDFINVESHMGSALYKNRLYFSDNPFSYANEEPKPVYIGCFDIETKKVDFLQEIPEMAGSHIAQIVCNDEKLYVRSSNEDLIVYEIPDSANLQSVPTK